MLAPFHTPVWQLRDIVSINPLPTLYSRVSPSWPQRSCWDPNTSADLFLIVTCLVAVSKCLTETTSGWKGSVGLTGYDPSGQGRPNSRDRQQQVTLLRTGSRERNAGAHTAPLLPTPTATPLPQGSMTVLLEFNRKTTGQGS